MRRALAILGLGWLLTLAAAWPAPAAALAPPVADCYVHNGTLTHSYTAAQLRTALATMPVDVKEYSVCFDVLQRALLQKIGKLSGGDSSGGGGSFLPAWLIAVLAVLVVAGAGFGAVALRDRRRRLAEPDRP
jgi:hypothetical protein